MAGGEDLEEVTASEKMGQGGYAGGVKNAVIRGGEGAVLGCVGGCDSAGCLDRGEKG